MADTMASHARTPNRLRRRFLYGVVEVARQEIRKVQVVQDQCLSAKTGISLNPKFAGSRDTKIARHMSAQFRLLFRSSALVRTCYEGAYEPIRPQQTSKCNTSNKAGLEFHRALTPFAGLADGIDWQSFRCRFRSKLLGFSRFFR